MMNEQDLNKLLMLSGAVLAVVAGLGTVVLLVLTATQGLSLIIPTILLAAVTVGMGWASGYYAQRTHDEAAKVFNNQIEQEVLTPRQRKELRAARGEVVMEMSMIDIENARDNITHNRLEAANDPTKPPHDTSFDLTPMSEALDPEEYRRKQRQIEAKRRREDHDY